MITARFRVGDLVIVSMSKYSPNSLVHFDGSLALVTQIDDTPSADETQCMYGVRIGEGSYWFWEDELVAPVG